MAFSNAAIVTILPLFLLAVDAALAPSAPPAAAPSSTGLLSIEDACKQTAELYDLCMATLSLDQSSLTADAAGLTRAAILAIQKNASETATYLSSIDEDDDFNKTAQLQQCLEDCGERYEAAVEQLTDAAMALDMGAYSESQALVAAGQAEVKLCQRGCQAVPEHRNILLARNTKVDRLCTIALGIAKLIHLKTALMLALCTSLRDKYSLAAVTNDIFTKEDGEFLVKHGALPEERIRAVETGGCPHAAIREDISINLGPLEELSNLYKADLLLCESGGDNLAANFSRELADYIIYIIDVSGGDKIPRKGGPGITQADLLVINKTDLAAAVGADLSVMERDALRMREGGPFVFAQVKHGVGVEEIVNHVLRAWEIATGNRRR